MAERSALVIGGGLIGVTTAWELLHRGVRTTLVEARDGVGLETSFANGATLTPSMPDPWNAPGCHRALLASLFDPGAAMKLRPSAIPGMAAWGVRFLRSATPARYAEATAASFALAHHSVAATEALRETLGLAYDARALGTLKIFRDAAAAEAPLALARRLAPLGLRYEALDRRDVVALEPRLGPVEGAIAGGIHFPDDRSGDAYLFTRALHAAFLRAGGACRLGAPVKRLRAGAAGVEGAVLATGELLVADETVVAVAAHTPALVGPLGVRLPIYPVKGYTLTFPAVPGLALPRLPVVDDALHALVVPVGDRLRVGGTAEFTGWDRRIRADRIANLRRLLAALYPEIGAALAGVEAAAWAGHRPVSADGLPFIGRTRVRGLSVNAGHGHLGWTSAVGSAELLADALEGRSSAIASAPFAPVGR